VSVPNHELIRRTARAVEGLKREPYIIHPDEVHEWVETILLPALRDEGLELIIAEPEQRAVPDAIPPGKEKAK
jgi:hypothetical protein